MHGKSKISSGIVSYILDYHIHFDIGISNRAKNFKGDSW